MACDALEDRIRQFLQASPEEDMPQGRELLQMALRELSQRHVEIVEAARFGQQLLHQLQHTSKADEQAADLARQTSLQIKVLQHKLRLSEQDAIAGASERENLRAQLAASEMFVEVEQKRCKRLEKRAADLEAQSQELEAAAAFLRTENLELACTLEQYERQIQHLQKSSATDTSAQPTPALDCGTPSDADSPMSGSPAPPPPPCLHIPPLRLPVKSAPSPRALLDVKATDDTAQLSRALSSLSTDSDSDVPVTARDFFHSGMVSARGTRNFSAAVAALATPRIYAFTPRLCNELLRQPPPPAIVTTASSTAPATAAPLAGSLPPPPAGHGHFALPSARGPSTSSVLDCLRAQPLRALVLALLQGVHPMRCQVTELQAETRELTQMMDVYLTQLIQCVNQLFSTLSTSQQRALDLQREAEKLHKLTDELYSELAQMKVKYATAQFEADYVLSAVENAKRLQAATAAEAHSLHAEARRQNSDSTNHPTPPTPRRGYWWPFS